MPCSACTAIAAPVTARGLTRSTHEPTQTARGGRTSRAGGRASPRVCAVLVFLVAGLLTSIFERKQEAKNPYVRLVEVNEDTTDPAAWGMNWAREYDGYQRTAESTQTRYGGSEALPAEKAAALSVAEAHVRRLRVRDRLPRSPRARLHAAGPGADQARHRAAAARLLPALSRLGDPDLSTARRRRRVQGVRGAGQAVVRRGPRRGGQDRIVEPGCGRHDESPSSTPTARTRCAASTVTIRDAWSCG